MTEHHLHPALPFIHHIPKSPLATLINATWEGGMLSTQLGPVTGLETHHLTCFVLC